MTSIEEKNLINEPQDDILNSAESKAQNQIEDNVIVDNQSVDKTENNISTADIGENIAENEIKSEIMVDNADINADNNANNIETNAGIFAEKQENKQEKTVNIIDENAEKRNAEIVEDELYGNKKFLRFRLSQFEGPLDLLCTLVKENKVEIEDIFISDITGQYLEIVTNSSFADVEYASEFLIMAATLLEIKSKKLLPVVVENIDGEIDPDYDEKMIIRQVKEYKLFKETSEKLAEQEALYQFTKAPVYTEDDYRICLTDFNLDKLVDAFARIVSRAEIKAEAIKPKTIIKERFTVSNRIKHIARSIFEMKKLNFFDLYDEDYSKLEIINTFLAILELLKRQYITATQEGEFEDIYLELREGVDAPLTLEEGEEKEIGY